MPTNQNSQMEQTQIPSTSLTAPTNALHVYFMSEIKLLIQSRQLGTAFDAKRTAFNDLYVREDVAFKLNQAYELTKNIEQLDRDRDNQFMIIKETVRTANRSTDPDKKTAAEKVQFALNPYAKSNSAALAAETAMIDNLVQDLQKPTLTLYVNRLALTATITALKSANDLFREVYDYRVDEKVGRKSIESMRLIRPQVDDAYRAVVQAINALWVANEMADAPDTNRRATLQMLINAIAGQIIQLEQNVANMGKKAGEEKERK